MDPATLAQLAMAAFQMFQKYNSASDAYSAKSSGLNAATDLAKSGTADAYGNKYVPGYGFQLSPESARLLTAEQQEMLKNLTTDADMNRNYRARMQDASIQGGHDYGDTLNEFKYGEKPDQNQYIDDYTRLGMINRGKGLDESKAVIARQLLRANEKGSLIDSILKKADEMFGKTLEESVIKGRLTGEQAYQGANSARNTDFLSKLGFFSNQAHSQPQANISKTSLYDDLGSMQSSGISNLLNAFKSSESLGASPTMDMSAISALIPKLFASSGETTSPWQNPDDLYRGITPLK